MIAVPMFGYESPVGIDRRFGFIRESAVTYSDDAKHRRLGVPRELLETRGAVSREVAAAIRSDLETGYGPDLRWMATTDEDCMGLLTEGVFEGGALKGAVVGIGINLTLDIEHLDDELAEAFPGPLTVMRLDDELVLGEVMNRLTEAAGSPILTKWDDDDWYEPWHVLDLLHGLEYSGAGLVGKEHLHGIAFGGVHLPVFVLELPDGDLPFGLVADVDQDKVPVHRDDPPLDDLSFLELLEAFFIHAHQILRHAFLFAGFGLEVKPSPFRSAGPGRRRSRLPGFKV